MNRHARLLALGLLSAYDADGIAARLRQVYAERE
jgi:hypothetical protein